MTRAILRSAVAVISGVLCGLILVEIVIRVTIGAPWEEIFPPARVQPDPDIGWTMVPGDTHYTYSALVRLNSHGFRGPEIADKRTGEYRILAVGDSQVYGQGLTDDELSTSALQHGLDRLNGGCMPRVINMGVRAYSMNNELALLQKLGMPLQPDHVIWFFYIDDFRKSDIQRWYQKFADTDWYMFDLLGKPTPIALWRWRLRQALRKSALLMWAHDIIHSVSILTDAQHAVEFKLLQGILDSDIQERIQFVEQGLDQLVYLSAAHGFSLTLAVIPDPSQLTTEYPKNLYQNELSRYAEEQTLDLLDLRPALRRYYEDTRDLPVIPFDGHYNAKGHALIATEIIEHLGRTPIRCSD